MGICTSKSSVKSTDQDDPHRAQQNNPRNNVTASPSRPEPPIHPKQEQETPQSPEASPEAGQNSDGSPNENINQVAQGNPAEAEAEAVENITSRPVLDPNEAATKIQAVFKGHQVRKHQNTKSDNSNHNTAHTPQPMEHSANEHELAEKNNVPSANDVSSNDSHSSMDPNLAATKIQAVFKGHQVRKNIKEHETGHHDPNDIEGSVKKIEIKDQGHTGNDSLHSHHTQGSEGTGDQSHEMTQEEIMNEEEAAVKIQAAFKGFKTRKEMKRGSPSPPLSD